MIEEDDEMSEKIDEAIIQEIENGKKKLVAEATSSEDGSFSVKLEPGKYIVEVEADGYETYYDEIEITGTDEVNLKFTLGKAIPKTPSTKPKISEIEATSALIALDAIKYATKYLLLKDNDKGEEYDTTTIPLRNLAPSKLYEVSYKAGNESGWSSPSPVASFITSLAGIVSDIEDLKPLNSVLIEVYQEILFIFGRRLITKTNSVKDGSFEIKLDEGKYQIVASKKGYEDTIIDISMPLEGIPPPPPGIVYPTVIPDKLILPLYMKKTFFELKGSVTSESTKKPIVNAEIIVTSEDIGFRTTSKEILDKIIVQTQSNRKGLFEFSFPEKGKYVIHISAPDYQPEKRTIEFKESGTIKIDIILEDIPEEKYIGNRRTKEVHIPECPWVALMRFWNKRNFATKNDALTSGYNGCFHCLRDIDTG